ncbi:hypothetical protein DER46DRAFT_653430 [Fusarium sp. MPI-SDFR-AT-0072]|nr:hypothetical protein DER46DRAFT_653430 [Fusarium sp. MPI-SDFR-AT-0072]
MILRMGRAYTARIPVTVRDRNRFIANVFAGWNSQQRASKDPVMPDRKINDTHIEAGTLTYTLPLTKEQIVKGITTQNPERRIGATVYLGLTLNYETGSILWTWRDFLCGGIPTDSLKIFDGMTDVEMRAEAIRNYDDHERERINKFNKEYIRANTHRAIKKWSREGSHPQHTIDIEDSALQIAKMNLASPCVRSEAERMVKVAEEIEASPPANGPIFP